MPLIIQKNTPVDDSRWTVERNNGDFIQFPISVQVMDSGTKRRYQSEPRLRNDGGIIVGDGTFDIRELQMMLDNYAENDNDFRAAINEIDAFFRDDQKPFYLVDNNNGIRVKVVPRQTKIKYTSGCHYRYAGVTIPFAMEDSLWETVDTKIQPGGTGGTGDDTGYSGTGTGGYIILSDTDEIEIVNSGKYDAKPVLTFIPIDNVVNFTFENVTQGGGFTFESNDLLAGTELIISSVSGSITLDGVEKSSSISSGGFISLLPGLNMLRYESDNGSIKLQIEWRERTAH